MVDEAGERKLGRAIRVEGHRRRTSWWWRRWWTERGGVPCVRDARWRCASGDGRRGVDGRRSLAGLVHVGLCEVDLLGEELDLGGDLVVVGDLRLVMLVGGLFICIEAADYGLEQVLQLVRGLRHGVEHAAGLRRGLGWWCRGFVLDQIEPRAGFCASSPERLAPDLMDVTVRSRADGGGGEKKLGSEYQIPRPNREEIE